MSDADALPAKQYLILEVLAARHRLGEPSWPLPDRLRKHLDALADGGWIGHEADITEGHRRAWLTDKGREDALSSTYTAPVGETQTRSIAGDVVTQATENLAALENMADELPADQSFLVLMVTDLTKQVRRLAQAAAGQDEQAPTGVRAALRKAAQILAMSSADHSAEHDRAALYAMLVGWGPALDEVAARWGWTPGQVAEIREMRAAVEAASSE